MNFNLTKPCKDCPFRKDVDSYLRKARVSELERVLVREQGTFTCHKTNDYSDEEVRETQKSEHCAGAMILLEKIGRPNQMMRIAERCRAYDHRKLDMEAPVFDSFAEMRKAQKS